MGKAFLADGVELDRGWLRRIRGKLTTDEVLRAKGLADNDVKSWVREIFGKVVLDDEMEPIPTSETDATPRDVASVVIDDLFHKDGDGFLDRLTNPSYERIVDLAELIASHYLMQWGDFMGADGDPDGSSQVRATLNALRRVKLELERIGSLTTTEDATGGSYRYKIMHVTVLNNAGVKSYRKKRA